MRKLTKEEKAFLDKLYADNELQFRCFARQFIIANTYAPKYKVGECVKVTDTTRTYICGQRIKNLNARVVKIGWCLRDKDREYITYELAVLDQHGREHCAFAEEPIGNAVLTFVLDRFITGKSDTDRNNFTDTTKSDFINA
jgi:hypothetical protein